MVVCSAASSAVISTSVSDRATTATILPSLSKSPSPSRNAVTSGRSSRRRIQVVLHES